MRFYYTSVGFIEKQLSRQEKMIIYISIGLIGIAIFGNIFLGDILGGFKPQDRNFIGLVLKADGDVRMRFGDSINWLKLANKDRIYSQTYLFTGKDSSAIYAFLDESYISIDSNSLIYMDFITAPTDRAQSGQQAVALNLVEGKMNINLKEGSNLKLIKVDETLINTGKEKTLIQLNYENEGMDVSVLEGNISIVQNQVSYNVQPGEKLEIENNKVEPVKKVDQKTLDEIKRIAEEDKKKAMQEIIEKRRIGNIINGLLQTLRD